MSFKDLMETLQQGTAKIQERRDLNEDALTGMATPLAQMKQNPGQRGRGPKKPGLGGRTSAGKGRLGKFLNAVATQESGGNYSAVGIPTSSGRAYGKYQILDSNIQGPGGWDQEALGRDITIQKFLNSPRLQEKIARAKLTDYFKQYGARGAAKAWYAGPGNADTNSDSPQYGGPSINDYAAEVLQHMYGGR